METKDVKEQTKATEPTKPTSKTVVQGTTITPFGGYRCILHYYFSKIIFYTCQV